MRIIQANKYYYIRGGAEKYMLELSDWLMHRDHEVVPFAMQHPQNMETPYARFFPKEIQTGAVSFGLNALHTLGRMLYSLSARRQLATLIAQTHPDVCHIHNIYTQLSPSILHTLKDQRVPVVMTVHDHHLVSPQYNVWAHGCGKDVRKMGILNATRSRFHKHSYLASFAQVLAYKFHRLLRLYERNVDVFICPSDYMKRQLVESGIDKRKIRVIPYGAELMESRPMGEAGKYILFVGRLSEEKGIEMVIQLAKLLPDQSFKIVGRGPEMEKLHHAGDKYPNIEFVGFRMGEELAQLYRQAIAVLVPSRVHEVFSLTCLEAMSFGIPVIASRVGGIPEVIEDGVNGFLVGPNDVAGWTESLMRVVYDNVLQRQMRVQARRLVETRFRKEGHFRAVEQCYRELK